MIKSGASAIRRLAWTAVLSVVVGLVVACGSVPSAPRTPEEIVRQRAVQRWSALMAGQWDRAYALMAPSYRSAVDLRRFSAGFGGSVGWLGAEVAAVRCDQDRCTATMRITYQAVVGARPGQPAVTHFDETWVREDGQWWMFQPL